MLYQVEQSKWYLIQCKPREGFRAEENLKNQSYICFHPTYKVKRKLAQHVQYVETSLFPTYLFVYLSSLDNWAPIKSTRGVNKIVHFNGYPASVDDFVINALKQRCELLNQDPQSSLYKPGDKVRVIDGGFKELEAIVMTKDADERVILLLNLFNREHNINMSVHSIRNVV